MHRLEQRRSSPVRVEVRGRCKANSAGDGATKIGQNVTKEVVSDDHVVACRVLNEVDARGIYVVVRSFNVRVFSGDLLELSLIHI